MRDGNRVQDSFNRLNWDAFDNASRVPQLSLLQLPLVPLCLLFGGSTVLHDSTLLIYSSLESTLGVCSLCCDSDMGNMADTGECLSCQEVTCEIENILASWHAN